MMKQVFVFTRTVLFALSVAGVMCLAVPGPVSAEKGEVYVYNWSEYMPDSVLSEFQKETGIKVVYTTYDSNEAMFAKVKLLKGGGYDLVFPSTYFVDRMGKEGLLQPIDKSRIPNLEHLDPGLMDKPYDPGNVYSVPYLWGSTAIGYNSAYVDQDRVTSWNDLWNPAYKGRVLLTNDLREVFGMGLKVLGYSGNDTDPAHIEAAYEKLRTLLPNVRLFASDSPKLPFLNQEVTIGMIWNGEIYMASRENPKIGYIYPKEGAMLWMDSMVIPKNARNVENAHAFINYLLRPEVAKTISEEIGYATPNTAALKLMAPEVRNNPIVYPDAETVQKGEFQVDVGEAILVYQKYWEKLKAGQ